jgi:hypothetical protein
MPSALIPEHSSNPFRLGRHLNQDPRNANYPFVRRVTGPTKSQLFVVVAGSLNQKRLGSCTGNAITHCCNCNPLHRHETKLFREVDAKKVYSRATQLDPFDGEYPPDDTGSDGTSACNAALEFGMITRFEHPEASVDGMIEALQDGPIAIGINWYNGMFHPDSNGFVNISPSDYVAGGHAICVRGVDLASQFFTFQQSWGKTWGLKGSGRIPFPTANRLMKEDGEVVAPRF